MNSRNCHSIAFIVIALLFICGCTRSADEHADVLIAAKHALPIPPAAKLKASELAEYKQIGLECYFCWDMRPRTPIYCFYVVRSSNGQVFVFADERYINGIRGANDNPVYAQSTAAKVESWNQLATQNGFKVTNQNVGAFQRVLALLVYPGSTTPVEDSLAESSTVATRTWTYDDQTHIFRLEEYSPSGEVIHILINQEGLIIAN